MFDKHHVWACNTRVNDKNPYLQFSNVLLDTKSKYRQGFHLQGQIEENGENPLFDLFVKHKYSCAQNKPVKCNFMK